MNYIDFLRAGGFPLEAETLAEMQSAYQLLQSFGDIVGEKSIIKGCKTVGSTVTNGVIYWEGELLEFRGGAAQSKIIIVDEPFAVEFEDGDTEEVYHVRYATFGTGINAVNWSEFKRAYPLTSAVFIDEIRMYAGDVANIPWGWYLADGQNGTMDLRDKFPVPYNPDNVDYNAIGKTGGLKEVTLTEAQMPSHSHSGTASIPPHTHNIIADGGSTYSTGGNARKETGNSGLIATQPSSTLSGTVTTVSKGGGEAHENRPPYKVVGFIQFKGV
jgi:microcystin-dependent protein